MGKRSQAKVRQNIRKAEEKRKADVPSKQTATSSAVVSHHNAMQIRGLVNLGNTCFFNSAIQVTMHENQPYQ